MFARSLVLVAVLVTPAFGQEKTEYVLTKDQTNKRPQDAPCKCEPKPEEKPKGPWKFKLRLGSVFQISQSKSVIGKLDGTSKSFQADIHGEANWSCGKNEVRNRLDTNDVIVKTQNTGRYVPASDYVELESIYQYHALPVVGPFARAGLKTSIFLGRDLRTNAVQYNLPDGMLTGERTELRLTDRFVPLTLLQSAGVFYNPIRKKHFDLDFRGGLGVREVVADDQLGVKDDPITKDIVELVGLHSYVEAGFETVAFVRAELWKERVSTYGGIETLIPVVRTRQPGDNRSNLELTSETVQLGIAYRIGKSATLLYGFRVINQPQLIDVIQIQNNAGFKATFNLYSPGMNDIKVCFERIEGALRKDPALGKGTGTTVARVHGGGLACEIESGPWKFVADMPPTSGGTASGPTPGMYGRAALGSCLAIGYAMRAAKAGLAIDNIEVEVQADYDDGALFGTSDAPPGYTEIRYLVRVTTSAPEVDVLRVLDDADHHSPYLDVFRRGQRCVRSVQVSRPG